MPNERQRFPAGTNPNIAYDVGKSAGERIAIDRILAIIDEEAAFDSEKQVIVRRIEEER